ncbi:peptidase M14 family protein [Candidatus Bathyarchaeota archaeon]|nr:peptidase M14 family protein [Candidatus Bathyarchaeota archaeon]
MSNLQTPESFFGFQLGSDRNIARWDKIVSYLQQLEKQSDRIKVINMGPSTEGNPFLLVIISSPENLSKLERYREINNRLANPVTLENEEAEKLILEGKAVILQSMSLHASEIGGTQMAPELIYDLISKDDEETIRIRENVITLIVPSFNPDGQIMVTDWYNKWLGTEYEGCSLPWLYHKYVGHDNNRDAFMTNMIESKYMAKIMFQDWTPQAYVDHHHMGSYGARLYVAPYAEPIHPNADPLIWREHSWYGAHMAYKLEENGKTGIINDAMFSAWGHLGFHWITAYHNIAGMLTESASAKLATPLFIHPHQLKGDSRGNLPEYEAQTNFPHPWSGGWWTLRDIVEQQKISAWATLDAAARNKETALRNAYLKAKRQIERGLEGNPQAYIISSDQHDSLTAQKLIEKLLVQGIEIQISHEAFISDGYIYPEGSYVIWLNQPKYGLIKTLLGKTLYPDNNWTRNREGKPLSPYDSATDTMAEFMGIQVDPVDFVDCNTLQSITQPEYPEGYILGESDYGYALDCWTNDSYIAANRILATGARLYRTIQPLECSDTILAPGAFIVEDAEIETLEKIAKELHLDFIPLENEITEKSEVKQLRVGMYQRYYGGNMDEGWTRFVLEQFEFPYKTITDKDFKEGLKDIDVIILPSDSEQMIVGEKLEEYYSQRGMTAPVIPPEYKSGIGKEGVETLKKWVKEGGILVCFNQSTEFAIKNLNLPVKNVLESLQTKDFYCPGSTLWAFVDNSNPHGYGMPDTTLILFWNSQVFEIKATQSNEDYEVIIEYPESDILQSGWLIGEKKIAKKCAMLNIKEGKGKVILFGFRPQNRAQTHGTFKLVFNCLLG